jgi:murE/murF fusion protein
MRQFTTPFDAAFWLRQHVNGMLRADSRLVQAGDGFLAWPGAATDARGHVAAALAAGAVACLVEHAGSDRFAFDDPRIASYAGLKAASGRVASDFFADPSRVLAVLAVTGTNGKTSTAWWLAQALSKLELSAHIPCGFIGTLGIGIPPTVVNTGLTTPDPVALQAAFANFASEGVLACAIEASSIGIQEHRLEGTHIHTAILTNLTQDHLDYHGSMAAYWQAKTKLFSWPGLRAAVVNVDDPYGAELAAEMAAQRDGRALDLWTVSMAVTTDNSARLQAQDIDYASDGIRFFVVEGTQRLNLNTRLIGAYNVANLLGVIAAMRSIGVVLEAAVQACSHLTPVPGRMACVSQESLPLAAVDYAHTPDALAQALNALRPLAQQRGGQLWCVFGCGGDRDITKRPLMGAMAGRHADRVVVTSDNPRSEAPYAIINQILLGLTGVPDITVEPDRAHAIARTLAQAAAADVVLVAGKGHENYQEIKGQRLPFSDLDHVNRALAQRQSGALPSASTSTAGDVGIAGLAASDPSVMMTLQQVAAALPPAQWVACGQVQADIGIRRVHTDTRSIEPGDLFVALCGERFDANDFLAEARAKGAVAAICQGDSAANQLAQAGLPGLVVPDAKAALGQLATHWRAQFTLPLIAVTGSNGKTTVTQMIASVLRAEAGDAALATQGNLNNEIGVPLTVLRLRAHHRIAVVELGMNHPGEIAQLARIAQPTVALVNNAQREHLEFMQTVQAVAHENGAVIATLPAAGVAVFPADDAYSAVWVGLAGTRPCLQFAASTQAGAEVAGVQADWSHAAWQVLAATPVGELRYALHIAGAHNVKNSLAAVACALAAGVAPASIAQGLTAFEPVKGRSRALQISQAGHPITLVDDTYNANPDSVRAAIDVLAALPGPRLLVLGDMGEVGDQGPAFHAEALAYALTKNIEKVLVTGTELALAAIEFESIGVLTEMTDLQAAVLADLPFVASVLVKGSRFMKMERVVEALLAATQEQGSATC